MPDLVNLKPPGIFAKVNGGMVCAKFHSATSLHQQDAFLTDLVCGVDVCHPC